MITVCSIKKIDDNSFEVNSGSDPAIVLDRLTKVCIATTDQGPWIEDVFLILYDADEHVFEIEQQAPFHNVLYEAVSHFEGFDYHMVIKAMQSTENNEFICWEKK